MGWSSKWAPTPCHHATAAISESPRRLRRRSLCECFGTNGWTLAPRTKWPVWKNHPHMAIENGPFEDVFPIEMGIFQPAILVYQRVNHFEANLHLGVNPKMVVPFPNSPWGFPNKNGSFWGGDWGYHHLRKHPFQPKKICFAFQLCWNRVCEPCKSISDTLKPVLWNLLAVSSGCQASLLLITQWSLSIWAVPKHKLLNP